MTAAFDPPSIHQLAVYDNDEPGHYDEDTCVIEGVIDGSGQGGWGGETDNYKVHCFSFAAWRRPGGPTERRELIVIRPVPIDADYWDDFPKYSVQKMRVLLSNDGSRAIFSDRLPVGSPPADLASISEQLRRPVVVETELFGIFTLDRSINWFKGTATWENQSVRVTIDAENDSLIDGSVMTAETLWADMADWNDRIEACILSELLQLKNEDWLGEEETELTSKAFLERLTLVSISIFGAGRFEFWFEDGDLFWGHDIRVYGSLAEGPRGASIEG